MGALLGGDRHRVVDALVDAFSEVERTGAPQWWSLEAPPGWGKTRLVQALFARLAEAQSAPAYWPSELLVEGADLAERMPEVVRKRVAPAPGSVDAQGVPEYFWWGISCLSRPGSEFEALAQDLRQFAAHREGLERRWRSLATRRQRAGRQWRARRKAVGEAALGEGLSLAAGAMNVAVPGLGLLVLLGRWGIERTSDLRSDALRSALPAARSIAEEVGPELERLGHAGVTLVIAVEDLHAADETLVELLLRLLTAEQSRVLLVTTSWPGLLTEADRPVHRLRHRVEPQRVRAGVDVGALDDRDRAAMAAAALPELDEAGALLIARRWTNPLAVLTACRLGAVRRAAARGALTREVLAEMPADVSGMYDQLWDELPPDVREALLLAALSAPASLGNRLGFGDERWDPAVLALALAAAPQLLDDASDLLPDLDKAGSAFSWIRTVEQLLQQFDEPSYREVALNEARREYATADRRTLHAALAATLAAQAEQLEPARRTHADRLLLALLAEGQVRADDPGVRRAAGRICTRLAASPAVADLEQVLAVTDAVDLGDRSDPEVLRLTLHRASALRSIGRVGEALAMLDPLVSDLRATLGEDAQDALAARSAIGLCLDQLGRSTAAVAELRAVAATQRRVLGDDAADTLVTRGRLATAFGSAGRFDDAVEAYAALTTDLERRYGPAQAVSLRARSNHAWWLGETGRITDAVAAYTELLAAAELALGPDAPDTLTIRSNLANWTGESGRVDEARQLLDRLVADRTRILGPEAPDTLRARSNRAWWLGVGGRPQDALRDLEPLLADRIRVLGPDAPDTLRTRRYIGRFRAQGGAVQDGVTLLRELLADQVRLFGEGSPEVAETREELARWPDPQTP